MLTCGFATLSVKALDVRYANMRCVNFVESIALWKSLLTDIDGGTFVETWWYVQVGIIAKLWKQSMPGRLLESSQQNQSFHL